MNRSTSVRLMRLEAAQPPECERGCHCLIINEGDDQEGLIAAMITSGEAQKRGISHEREKVGEHTTVRMSA